MSTANLQNAVWLGSRGLHIFPLYPVRSNSGKTACACNDGANCKRIGKHPIHDDFAERATCDENAIRLLWEPCPDAEIALLTGQKSGIVALEIRPNDDNPDPLRGYAVPPAPAIVCAGKTVRLYSAPDEPIKGRVKLGNGLALRGEKSFVVLPDAIAANGEKYDWAPGQALQTTRISPLPSYFLNPPRHDEPEFTAELHSTDYQPTPEECAAWNKEQEYRDEPSRASVNPDEPEIKAQWSGTERQHESQPATNATPQQWRVIPLDELFETPDPPDNSICAALGIWHGDRPMGIIGASGTAKTWIMDWLALQFATGRPLFGNPEWPIKRPLRVLILDYELSRRVYKKRLGNLCETMVINYRDVNGMLCYGEHPPFYLTDDKAEECIRQITAQFDVVLIDALRPAAPNADENMSDFRRYIDLCTRIAMATGQLFVFLHHAGKTQGPEPRGSSGIRDAFGATFNITAGDNLKAPLRVENKKMGPNADNVVEPFFIQLTRDGEDGKGPMRITFMTEEQAEEQAEEKVGQFAEGEWSDRMKRILTVIRKNPGKSRNVIGEIVKGNKPKRDKIIDWLLKNGLIENKGTDKSHKYEITAAGQEWIDKGSRYAPRVSGPNASTTPNAPPNATDAPESPVLDDASHSVATTPAQPIEQANNKSAETNQSAIDPNIKTIVEYVVGNDGCTKAMVNQNTRIKGEPAKAARDTAQYQGYIRFAGGKWYVTDKGRELFKLPSSAPSSADNAPPPFDTSTDTPEPATDA